MIHFLDDTNPKLLRGTVLLRLDFNTEDDWRMKAVVPTIKFLLQKSCKIVILSHRGRPRSYPLAQLHKKTKRMDGTLSLKKDAGNLSRLLKREIVFIDHFDLAWIKKKIVKSPPGSIILLENLRFIKGEEENEAKFAKQLASLGDLYVNDAFAVSHRANASVAAITKFLPSYAGLELEAEIKHLSAIMARPARPFVMVIGGAKVADKLGVLRHFKRKADWFLLGGGPANTILAAHGMDIKKSLCDKKNNKAAIKEIARYPNLLAPTDYLWKDDMILDIGPKTTALFKKKIGVARTFLWSGPLGLIDTKPYDRGSRSVAAAIAKNRRALSVAGGGETVMFLRRIHQDKKFSFISTGGGAMLDFLAGEKLPGIEALKTAKMSFRARRGILSAIERKDASFHHGRTQRDDERCRK
jgi:phosphoglycerate kinase